MKKTKPEPTIMKPIIDMKSTKPEPTIMKPITDTSLLPAFLTVEEVATLTRRKRRSIYDLVEKGDIPFSRPQNTRMIIFKRDDILAWINPQTKSPGLAD